MSNENPPQSEGRGSDSDGKAEGVEDESRRDADQAGHADQTPAPDGDIEVTETTYEVGPTGQRITRRKVRKTETVEEIEETITEDVALDPYQAPHADHPAPVG